MLFQFIPFLPCSNSAQELYGYPNVHSALRSMNREAFSRRGSKVGPSQRSHVMPIDRKVAQQKSR